jgi:hypothetical protein
MILRDYYKLLGSSGSQKINEKIMSKKLEKNFMFI